MNKNSKILFVLGGIFLILAILLSTPSLIDGNVAASGLEGKKPTKTKINPTATPTKTKHSPKTPTAYPTYTYTPTTAPTNTPTSLPSNTPTSVPTNTPTAKPTNTPTDIPAFTPTAAPSITPTETTPDDEFIPLVLSGICSGIPTTETEAMSISWEVINDNPFAVAFAWSANNSETGTGIAPANGSANFTTAREGNLVSIDYSYNEESFVVAETVIPCPLEQPTKPPTTVAVVVPEEEPKAVVDPAPDQPAGGSGPSFTRSVAPFVFGVLGLGSIAAGFLKMKKRETLNN